MGSCCSKAKDEGTGAKMHSNPQPQQAVLQQSLPLQTINTSPSPPQPEQSDQVAPQAMETHNPRPSPLKSNHPASSPQKLAQSYRTILGKPLEDVRNYFTLGKELGQGQFGATYFCTEKATGQSYACKSISKCKLVPMKDMENVKREIKIMQRLTGQPNVVKFKGAYEDELSVHIIMELCAGGELFDRIIAKRHYSECDAASICREIVCVINTCHLMGVMHRDIKPENFLFAAKGEGAILKAIDFGLSVFIEEGKAYRDIVGSAYYVAPEVLNCSYGKEIDIWSAGIILYILLSGAPPFRSETEKGLFDAILQRDVDLERAPWPSISNSAKDLLRKMLTRDPKKRITSAQVLAHPWVREGGGASYEPISNAVLSRMKQFRSMNKLKKLALKVIAENIYEEEIKGLKQMFAKMDTDKSGSITCEELKTGLRQLDSKLSDAEVKKLMDAADVDGSGTIDYIGFITATMLRHRLEREENLCRAFQYFDKDKCGYITRDALETAMKDHGMSDSAVINEIMGLIDKDNDGRINYEEFCTMIRTGH